jgi:Arc/MetJ-type ribon-helix-helix transcriptional regulator
MSAEGSGKPARIRSLAKPPGIVDLEPSMVSGMASKKVTVTLPEEQLDRVRALVAAGTAPSVSAFVQHAVGVAVDDVAGWGAMLAGALHDSGGPLTAEEKAWADEVLGVGKRRKRNAA